MTQLEADRLSGRARTQTVAVAGAVLTYRELGTRTGTPLVALTHLGANLDGWDPAVVDALAQDRRVVLIGYRGVGGSTGRVRDSMEDMATDMEAAIRALGYSRVDLFGLSMGGMVAQVVAARAPELVDHLILAGSGPAGGPALTGMTRVTLSSVVRALATFRDPKELLFFTRTPTGRRAAREYLARLTERRLDRERAVTPGVFRAQLAAVHRWGRTPSVDLSALDAPVLIVHGDGDRMVPPANAGALSALLPAATSILYPDAGHGVVFQNPAAFVAAARDVLRR